VWFELVIFYSGGGRDGPVAPSPGPVNYNEPMSPRAIVCRYCLKCISNLYLFALCTYICIYIVIIHINQQIIYCFYIFWANAFISLEKTQTMHLSQFYTTALIKFPKNLHCIYISQNRLKLFFAIDLQKYSTPTMHNNDSLFFLPVLENFTR
jgi:hypothetical protein